MRERWFGATGRRVPEIALEGELDLEGALVLDGVDDDALRAAHAAGPPGRRAGAHAPRRSRRRSRGPRSRARSSSDPALLDLDLTELTYG